MTHGEGKLVESWAAAQAGGSVAASPPRVMAAEESGSCGPGSPILPLQASGQQDQVLAQQRESKAAEPPASSLPASHSTLVPALPGLRSLGYHAGVITGHSRLRVRMEEAQLSAGTHQRPNPALAAGRRGRAAQEKGDPARCSRKAFLNPSRSGRQGGS